MSTIKDALNRFITGVWFFPYLKQAKETDLPEPIGVTKSGKLVKLDPSSAVGPEGPKGDKGDPGDSIVPTPPETGTAILKSVDGVLSWVAE